VPYFFILPLFAAFLLALLTGAGILFFTRFRKAAPYVLGTAIGSLLGFIGANAVLFLGLRLFVKGRETMPPLATPGEIGSTVAGVAMVGVLVVVPFVVSALGAGLGAMGGVYATWRLVRARKHSRLP
jgi:hypothetical protein